MKLQIEKHTLNEELSCGIYQQMNKWYMEAFGESISHDQCQSILTDYKYVIDYAVCPDEETETVDTAFFVTVTDKHILETKLKDISYYAFDLDVMVDSSPTFNDSCLKEIIEKDRLATS